MQAKRRYQEVLEAKNVLEADNEELKMKYQSKAQWGPHSGHILRATKILGTIAKSGIWPIAGKPGNTLRSARSCKRPVRGCNEIISSSRESWRGWGGSLCSWLGRQTDSL